ncbi:MAG TPA: hypothetical protein VHW96_00865 [Solirubrobacteraceae bacterium]|nr:hypothetical protein [Solirubrobacteraceae bacterium]
MFGVIIPVGPGDREIARLHQLLAELAEHEDRQDAFLAIADDDPTPRTIDVDWPVVQVFRTEARERGGVLDAYGAMVASTLQGLRICRERGVDMVLKLDTDAAVIGPFAAKIRAAFRDDPKLGVVGSYDVTSAGGHRDWSVWASRLRRVDLPLRLVRAPRGRVSLRYKSRADRDAVRRLVDAACRHAPQGAHCLGGAYAVSRTFLDGAELASGRWLGTGLGEDVVVGILCSAVGLRMCSLVGRDQPFALAWRGLPASPSELARGGHSLVHSVKAETPEAEREIRAALRSAAG